MPDFLSPSVTGVSPLEVWPFATFVATFMDGKTIRYPETRYLAMLGYRDPVKVNGTTVEIESEGEPLTLLGVRSFTYA